VDNATVRAQLTSLERKVVGGHEEVTHPSTASAHDDVATAVCGALVVAAGQQSSSAWMSVENLRRVNAEIALRPANPKYQQHRGPDRYMQSRFAEFYERQIGERRYAQMRRGIIPGQRPEK
jgi:hypothetical protein